MGKIALWDIHWKWNILMFTSKFETQSICDFLKVKITMWIQTYIFIWYYDGWLISCKFLFLFSYRCEWLSHKVFHAQIADLVQHCIISIANILQILQSGTKPLKSYFITQIPIIFNTLRLRQNGCPFPGNIFKCIFLNENVWVLIKNSLKFVPKYPIKTFQHWFK